MRHPSVHCLFPKEEVRHPRLTVLAIRTTVPTQPWGPSPVLQKPTYLVCRPSLSKEEGSGGTVLYLFSRIGNLLIYRRSCFLNWALKSSQLPFCWISLNMNGSSLYACLQRTLRPVSWGNTSQGFWPFCTFLCP